MYYMNLNDRRWKMTELYKEVAELEEHNYPINPRECVIMAVRKLIPEYELIDIYALYGITYEEYIEDTTKAYLRWKSSKLSELWRNSVK